MGATKTKKFGLFIADSRENQVSYFLWYETELAMYDDLIKGYIKIYFDDEDVNHQNDFLKNFDLIIRDIKRKGLSSVKIFERIKTLLMDFKIAMPYYDFENSYIGAGISLWISQDFFPMQLRGVFRSTLYGFNLDNNIDLGRAPIEFRETIRFEEFLEGPIKIG